MSAGAPLPAELEARLRRVGLTHDLVPEGEVFFTRRIAPLYLFVLSYAAFAAIVLIVDPPRSPAAFVGAASAIVVGTVVVALLWRRPTDGTYLIVERDGLRWGDARTSRLLPWEDIVAVRSTGAEDAWVLIDVKDHVGDAFEGADHAFHAPSYGIRGRGLELTIATRLLRCALREVLC